MRKLYLLSGLVVLAVVWSGPLSKLAGHAFYAHMIMHMGVVAVAAPLLSLAVAGGRFDPVYHFPVVLSPIPASILELIVVWSWHAPGLHHIARQTTAGLIVEQGSFLLTGLLLWLSAFGGDRKDLSRAATGVIGLLLTAMHMTFLGALLALTPRPLYQHHHALSYLSPLEDQHLGGAIMLLAGSISYIAGGLWLSSRLLAEKTVEQREGL